MWKLKNNQGITMVEVVVTIAISIIGLVGIGTMMLKINKAVVDTESRSQAVLALDDIGNRIKANPLGIDTYASGIDCGIAIKNCSTTIYGGMVSAAVSCNAEELAIHDLNDLFCQATPSTDADTNHISKTTDYLIAPQLSVRSAGSSVILRLDYGVRSYMTMLTEPTVDYVEVNVEL